MDRRLVDVLDRSLVKTVRLIVIMRMSERNRRTCAVRLRIVKTT